MREERELVEEERKIEVRPSRRCYLKAGVERFTKGGASRRVYRGIGTGALSSTGLVTERDYLKASAMLTKDLNITVPI